jgi:hypothetical protein
MNPNRTALVSLALGALGGALLAGAPAHAAVVKQQHSELDARAVADERLQPPARNVAWTDAAASLDAGLFAARDRFLAAVGGTWQLDLDPRSGYVGFIEGSGLPWIPGYGNSLAPDRVAAPLGKGGAVDLATLEALARAFVADHGALLGVGNDELALDAGRSGRVADYLWYVDFDVVRDGLEIEGSRVVFRVNNGNLVQVGTENVPPRAAKVPATRLDRAAALAVLGAHVVDFDAAWDTLLDPGTLRLLPAAPSADAVRGEIPFAAGLELVKVWEIVFRREGDAGTWRARIDAETGELRDFRDTNQYGVVTGGVRNGDDLPPDTILPMPFADVSSGGFTNSAGVYGGTTAGINSTLQGQYVGINDNCGAISMASNAAGDILFGSSAQAATNCTTPGVGGAGNTKSARTQFYWLNRTKEQARGWVTRAWLNAQLDANVNINNTCNAFWNGATVNFYRSGGGCGNTGELPGVSLHEYGHGFDSNDGNGSSPENGTGETYGDFTAALATHDSCIGGGFLTSNCGGYGWPCTSCTGVRDIDYAMRNPPTPATVANFTQPQCPAGGGYNDPCGREGHCGSYVSSQALWDFPMRDLPNPGSGAAWSVTERLWYLSRQTAGSAFACTTGGTFTSNGCFAASYWRTMRAADDDDGNLANGTPHSCDLYDAFNRHLIACTTDTAANVCFTACTPPAAPSLSLAAGNNQVTVTWTPVGGQVYDLYRNEAGCSAGFVKIANDLGASPYVDNTVANGLTYYYQMVAQPTGNEACGSAPSACVSATPTPCSPVAAPTGVGASATAPNQITVSWNDSATAAVTSYDVLRSTVSGGPYSLVGNVADGGAGPWSFQDDTVSGGLTYFYVVRANAPAGCQSPNSAQASATATGECTLPPTFAGLQSVTNLGGGQGCGLRLAWNAATAQCGGALTYAVYRSTTPGFTPGPANRIAACVGATTFDDTTMPLDTSLYYVVRAEDGGVAGSGPCNGGNEDANLAQATGFASSTGGSGTLYSNGFETGTGLADWVTGIFGGDNATDWRGIQTCAAHAGTRIFRFGNTACTTNYSIDDFAFAQPDGADGIAVPLGSSTVRLNFWHRWNFEVGWDGSMLAVSLDGTNYTLVPASAILSNPYNGTTDNGAGYPAWTGAQAAFVNTIVNLDAACVAAGAAGGCAGQNVRIAFTGYSDASLTDDGWFLDDVTVTRDAIPACTAAPSPVSFLTATGKDQQVTVEWVNPTSGPFASTRLRTSTAAAPADPAAGTLLVDEPGSAGQKELHVHASGGGSNGTVQHYSAFANSGANVYSAKASVSGLPQATAGNWKWNFSTPASALAPPIQGRGLGVYVPSNDRGFYALAIGAAGGNWKSGYLPAAMNAPAQSSPIVMLAADTGLPHDASFLGSQDGHVYCFNAATGAGCTGWPAGGRSVDGFGMVQAQPMFDPVTDRLLFGSRNAVAANGFHAVNVLTGATAWSFTNSVPQGGNGQAMGLVSGPALILGSRVVFASRTRAGGSPGSVWALDITAGSAALAWRRDLGDIDGAPTHDWTSDRVIVGTNAGAIYALSPATGAPVWTRAFADGAVRGWIYYDPTSARFYFATSTAVRAIPASGATGSDWVVSGLFSPSRPILHFGTTRTYLGACADAGCANGRVIELDAANSWAAPKVLDLAGLGGLGPVTIDRSQNLLHAGSRTGRVVAVALPLP